MMNSTEEAIHWMGKGPVLRRVAALLIMLLILVAFRQLALLLVSFLIASRAFGWLARHLAPFLGGHERRGVILVFVLLCCLIGVGLFSSFQAGNHLFASILGQREDLTIRLTDVQADVLRRIPSWVHLDELKGKVPGMVEPAVGYARETGRILLEVLVGLILSAVYLLDRKAVDDLIAAPLAETLLGTLRRYVGYLGEAVIITIQLQLLVALVNTVLTLPVLLTLRVYFGMPHVFTFTAVIFFCSLVPVVGNLISGAVLIAASYVYCGLVGVFLFVGTTFVLHKIEAYYLNPRLTSRHVHLPALVLIISLIAFEHVFGLVGLFLSFPALYVGIKVAQDFRRGDLAPLPPQDQPAEPATTVPPPPTTASN